MEQEYLSIVAKLDADHSVEFADQDDLFIFLANTGGYEHLAPAYENVRGEKLTTSIFSSYQAKKNRFLEIVTTMKLTDGETVLLDFIAKKQAESIKKRGWQWKNRH